MGKLSSDRRPGRGDGCTFNHQSFYFCFYITCSPSNDRRRITNKHHAITDAFMEAIRPAGWTTRPNGSCRSCRNQWKYEDCLSELLLLYHPSCQIPLLNDSSPRTLEMAIATHRRHDGGPDIYNSRPLSTVPMYW